MTAQTPDTLLYQSESYDMVGVSGKGLVTPQQFNIKTQWVDTGNWRGYECHYSVLADTLVLTKLVVSSNHYPPINGVPAQIETTRVWGPAEDDEGLKSLDEKLVETGYRVYADLNISVPFTGGFLAGRDFIDSMYVHMGFQLPFRFERLLELRFKNGKLTSVVDQSARMADVRRKMSQQRRSWEAAHQADREDLEVLDAEIDSLRLPLLGGPGFEGLSQEEIEGKKQAIDIKLDTLQKRKNKLQRLLEFPHSEINEILWAADSFSLDYAGAGMEIYAVRLYRLWQRSVSATRRFLRIIKNRGKAQIFKHSSTMRGQIRDMLVYQAERYDIMGVNGAGLIEAQNLGITSFVVSNGVIDECRRGHINTYAVEDGCLFLVEMVVGRDETLAIGGIAPVVEENKLIYKGLHIEVPFTGGLLVARDFDDTAACGTVIWGMQKPFRFEKLLELCFESGKVTATTDYSTQIAEKRQKLVDEDQAWKTAHRAEQEEIERLREKLAALLEKRRLAGSLLNDEREAVSTMVEAEILPLQTRLNELLDAVRPPRSPDSMKEWADFSFSLDYEL